MSEFALALKGGGYWVFTHSVGFKIIGVNPCFRMCLNRLP